jgi:hypothetical protein
VSSHRPPRRALFAADPERGSWLVESSDGWADAEAPKHAAWMLDTDIESIRIADFAGCFAPSAGTWNIVRGRVAPEPNPSRRYWREAIAIDEPDMAALRFNAFRIFPGELPGGLEPGQQTLSAPVPPAGIDAARDLERLSELARRGDIAHAPVPFDRVVAATLGGSHSLVLTPAWSYGLLELMLLLLPPRLRGALTFHSCATSLPRDPVPRLVLAPPARRVAFEAADFPWTHRVPDGTEEIGNRASEAALALLDLLATPARLVEAHERYERESLRSDAGGDLVGEIEVMLRSLRPDPGHSRFAPPAAQVNAVPIEDEAGSVVPEAEPQPDAPPRDEPDIVLPARRRPRRRVVLAAAAALVLIAIAIIVARASRTGTTGSSAIGYVAVVFRSLFPRSATAAASAEDVRAAVNEARTWAAVGDYGRALDLLETSAPARSAPEAFAWDSLVAYTALGRARQLPAGDAARRRLLERALGGATRALATLPPFGAGGDELRVLRAEVCIEGALDCDVSELRSDLLLAARGRSRALTARAMSLLARLRP